MSNHLPKEIITSLPIHDFIKVMKKFNHFRIRFKTDNKEPFKYHYFRITKKELKETVISNKMIVSYEICYNSKIKKDCDDILYIMKMRMTILDL